MRFGTRRHWIPFISEKIVPSYSTYVIDKVGKKRNITYKADFGGGLQFMTTSKKQFDIRKVIGKVLKEGSPIPTHEGMYLDAFNYFEVGRTNESVIVANIAFEEFTKYLFDKGY